MKSKVMGVDAANRRKNESSGVRGKAVGGAGAGAFSKASVPTSKADIRDVRGSSGMTSSPRPQSRSSAMPMDKAPRPEAPRPAPRPADLKANFDLERAMRGTEAKAIKEDLRAGREDRMSRSSAPSRSPRPMARFEDGGEVRGCKGVQMSGKSFKGNF